MSDRVGLGSGTPDEVAAVLAAIEIYLAGEAAAEERPGDPWIRAARREAVGRPGEITFGRGWER